mgnify:FL=1|jgi:hypothetical protein|tara:strand:- start:381 stop:554 length:174 start_codon:yes stop_codon:yes gene_type:complete
MANDKSVNKKRSISARVDMAVYEKMLEVAKDPNHKYYDRKVAYIVNKLLLDWLTKEK